MPPRSKLPCPFCPKKSFRIDNWKRHMNAIHPGLQIDSSSPSEICVTQQVNSGSENTTRDSLRRLHFTENGLADQALTSEPQEPGDSLPVQYADNSRPQPSPGEVDEVEDEGRCERSTLPTFVLSNTGPSTGDTEHILSCRPCWSRLKRSNVSQNWLDETLISAIRTGNPKVIKHLLNIHANTQFKDGEGRTALHWAIWLESGPEIVRLLCYEGFSLNMSSYQGQTPLNMACRKLGHELSSHERDESVRVLTIQILIGAGADPNIPDREGNLPIHIYLEAYPHIFASVTVIQECLEAMVKKTKNLLTRGSDGRTPLYLASHCSVSAVELLLQQGADPTERDYFGYSLLHAAASVEIAKCLLDHWPDSLYVKSDSGFTPFRLHINSRHYEVVKELLKRDPRIIHEVDDEGGTCLHTIFQHPSHDWNNTLRIKELLLQNGCAANAKDREGNTALHLSIMLRDFPRDDIELYNTEGKLIKQAEETEEHFKSIELLIANGANINEINGDGYTPLGMLLQELLNLYSTHMEQMAPYNFMDNLSIHQRVVELGTCIGFVQQQGGKITEDEYYSFDEETRTLDGSSEYYESLIGQAIGESKVIEEKVRQVLTPNSSDTVSELLGVDWSNIQDITGRMVT